MLEVGNAWGSVLNIADTVFLPQLDRRAVSSTVHSSSAAQEADWVVPSPDQNKQRPNWSRGVATTTHKTNAPKCGCGNGSGP